MRPLKVKDLLPYSTSRPSVVSTDATLREVVAKLIEDVGTREVYVTDEEEHFYGVITLRRLARFVFTHALPAKSSPTELLELVSAECAKDLALRKAAYVHEDDPLEHVIEVMFRFDINEIPVVNRERRIVGNLNMLQLLAAWHEGLLGT